MHKLAQLRKPIAGFQSSKVPGFQFRSSFWGQKANDAAILGLEINIPQARLLGTRRTAQCFAFLPGLPALSLRFFIVSKTKPVTRKCREFSIFSISQLQKSEQVNVKDIETNLTHTRLQKNLPSWEDLSLIQAR